MGVRKEKQDTSKINRKEKFSEVQITKWFIYFGGRWERKQIFEIIIIITVTNACKGWLFKVKCLLESWGFRIKNKIRNLTKAGVNNFEYYCKLKFEK